MKKQKCWQGISLSGVILVCTFLAACGGETQETVTETVDEAEGETTAVTGDLSIANDFGYETAREAAFFKGCGHIGNHRYPSRWKVLLRGESGKF